MSETTLEQIFLSDEKLVQAEKQFREAREVEEKLRQRRRDGKLLYEDWYGTQDRKQWSTDQLERQRYQCAICGKQMKFGKRTYLANGDFELEPDHPTVEHILPKSYFPELALNKQNLVITCWTCNRRKGNSVVSASRLRHQQLVEKIKQSLFESAGFDHHR